MFGFMKQPSGLPLIPFNSVDAEYDNSEGAAIGTIRQVANDDGTVHYQVRAKNTSGGAMTAGRPYMSTFNSAGELCFIVPATRAFSSMVAFPTTAIASGGIGWFAFAGNVDDLVLTNGAGIAAGDFLEVINAGTYLIEDGSSESAVSVAVALEAGEGSTVAKRVFLIGKPVTIAAA